MTWTNSARVFNYILALLIFARGDFQEIWLDKEPAVQAGSSSILSFPV